jgi:hypothetical protein
MTECPHCKEDDKTLDGGVRKDIDKLRVTFYCFRCQKSWTEVYVFLEIEEEKEKKNVPQTETYSGGD